jgi:hypothetical protein
MRPQSLLPQGWASSFKHLLQVVRLASVLTFDSGWHLIIQENLWAARLAAVVDSLIDLSILVLCMQSGTIHDTLRWPLACSVHRIGHSDIFVNSFIYLGKIAAIVVFM